MKDFMKSLQYQSDKLDELVEGLVFCKQSIQELKRKNTEMSNKNSNLETRIGALEQRLQEIEQQKLGDQIEISNIPYNDKEDARLIVEEIANKLQLPKDDVVSIQTKVGSSRNEMPGPILLKMKNETIQNKWITTSKKCKISVKDVVVNTGTKSGQQIVYIRESLTPYNKNLLWNAKQQLKDKYKFIWSKKGVIRVRKDSDSVPIILRSIKDISRLVDN
ncbi:uncharacterized protein LOC125075545 [Vanessa atalanta]|uniref:uncharacterized protein LOC125075545 n=1 Tax=Vanessa atalanta TaxID=42275 RepID=UPI001FCE0947|nr:uncharacterized protein LOC125075545 [Vanessa atalanta]